VSTNFRYVAIAPNRIEDRKALGPASYLDDFLVDNQTDAEGNVYYGKPVSYAWIRSRWPQAPPVRTLKRHMARLKAAGRVWVHKLPFHEGMLLRMLRSAKWAPKAAQLKLFPSLEIVSKSSGKAVEKLSNSTGTAVPKVSPQRCQKWPHKEVRSKRREKKERGRISCARFPTVQNVRAIDARRQLLAEQARAIQLKYQNSG